MRTTCWRNNVQYLRRLSKAVVERVLNPLPSTWSPALSKLPCALFGTPISDMPLGILQIMTKQWRKQLTKRGKLAAGFESPSLLNERPHLAALMRSPGTTFPPLHKELLSEADIVRCLLPGGIHRVLRSGSQLSKIAVTLPAFRSAVPLPKICACPPRQRGRADQRQQ